MRTITPARHHLEWLKLVEVSGPFLSLPVLLKAFPQGLDALDPELFAAVRAAHAEWHDSLERRGTPDPLVHRAWARFVLRDVLGYEDATFLEGQAIPGSLAFVSGEHGETIRPDVVVKDPTEGRYRLLVAVYPAGQEPEKPVPGRAWRASPLTRMAEHLRATNVRLGLVTNGEKWVLVDAPRNESTAFATWHATGWVDERITLQAFRSLLSARRLFGVADDETLEGLLAASASYEHEVTDQLGLQVRQAVELLVAALDRADADASRSLLAGISEKEIYEAALTVMMRLVFLFCAEERRLFPIDNPLFVESYAVSTLGAQLREAADQHGEEVLERRRDAWCRLLAMFRMVHSGARHGHLAIPAYGGGLFDPDRLPFLEGRRRGTSWRSEAPVEPLPLDNRTVLHLLEALQLLEVKVPGGGSEARRLSFEGLGIEQIGHVYEGLLDHTAMRAAEPILGLAGSKAKEPELPLSRLEAERAKGLDSFVEFLREETGRSKEALQKALASGDSAAAGEKLIVACGTGDAGTLLRQRVAPYGRLLRTDRRHVPVVIRERSLFVTSGTDRRSSGTHYTPRSLTEPIVRHTLESLVYAGPAEGNPPADWTLRSAAEILDLRVLDFACGSGAFLVQACRYLADRLLETWDRAERSAPESIRITPYGKPATGAPGEEIIPKDPDERAAYAQRIVAQRCLYGVDKNPLAVEMAKLSLWLLTLAKDRPFTFLDHAIRTGDSLVGVEILDQLKNFSLDISTRREKGLYDKYPLDRLIDETIALRLRIEETEAHTIADIEAKAALLAESEEKTERLQCVADILVAAARKPGSARDRADDYEEAAMQAHTLLSANDPKPLAEAAARARAGRPRFHWPLEFPEVMLRRGGFDAIVSNPPFMGGQKITGALGKEYRDHLVEQIARDRSGSADLCAYFFLRASRLIRPDAQFGMLATNTIAQGDTREVGLEQILADGCRVIRAVPSRKWPGVANLEVASIWIRRGSCAADAVLEERPVRSINAHLAVPGRAEGKPHRLAANRNKSFQGSIVGGMGFVMTPEEAQALIAKDPRNRDVLFPYLNGEDLNSRWDQSPSRWVINFLDWPLDRATAPAGYTGPVAADYPDCLAIVREKVYPERLENKRKVRRERWWQYAERAPELYATIARLERVLCVCLVTQYVAIAFEPSSIVFAHRLAVFGMNDAASFALLQSNIHEPWARVYSSSLETRLNYSPSDCFETFPFPIRMAEELASIGSSYESRRSETMSSHQEGLTETYNRLHDRSEAALGIHALRDLQVEMDHAVASAYGWTDLDLGHGFHETKLGIRFTISDTARREVLDRLLELNHARYEEEVEKGLHETRKPKKPGTVRVIRGRRPSTRGGTLF